MPEENELSIKIFKKIAEEGLKAEYGEKKGAAIAFLLFGGFGHPGLIDDAQLALEAGLSTNPKEVAERFTKEAATSLVTDLASVLLKSFLAKYEILPEVFIEAATSFFAVLFTPSDIGNAELPDNIRTKIITKTFPIYTPLPVETFTPILEPRLDLLPKVTPNLRRNVSSGSDPRTEGDGRGRFIPQVNGREKNGQLPEEGLLNEGGSDGRGRANLPKNIPSHSADETSGEGQNINAEGDGRGRAALPKGGGRSHDNLDNDLRSAAAEGDGRGRKIFPQLPDTGEPQNVGVDTGNPRAPSGPNHPSEPPKTGGNVGPKPSTPESGNDEPRPFGGIMGGPRPTPGVAPDNPSSNPTVPSSPEPKPDGGAEGPSPKGDGKPKPAPKTEPKGPAPQGSPSKPSPKPKPKRDEPVPPGVPHSWIGVADKPKPKPKPPYDREMDSALKLLNERKNNKK